MKRVLSKLMVLVMVFAMVFSTTVPVAAVTKSRTIHLKNKTTTVNSTLTAGYKLKLTVKEGKKTIKVSKVSFKSSKKSVATVSKKGIITAKKAGKATITIKARKKTVKLKVTVKKKPAPKPVEPKREEITLPFMSTWNDSRQARIKTKWSVEDLDYKASNKEPNQYLTIAALTLATNIETTHPGANQWDLVLDSLNKLGFTENQYHAYFKGDVKDQAVDYPAMAFATHKQKVNGKHVVAAVFRGSSSFEDFITDALSQIGRYINKDTDSEEDAIDGFYEVGVNATKELENYLANSGFSRDDTVVFITGHSLGAATASLVGLRTAAYLVNPDSVFCYPFATPNYFKGIDRKFSSLRMTGKDMKMFSFDNEEDIVPDVPLGLSYYKTLNRINIDREWIEANDKDRYALFNEIYKYLRGRYYEEDNSKFMPKEYSFEFFRDYDIDVNSIMVRNHMPYTYMALILSGLPEKEALSYIP